MDEAEVVLVIRATEEVQTTADDARNQNKTVAVAKSSTLATNAVPNMIQRNVPLMEPHAKNVARRTTTKKCAEAEARGRSMFWSDILLKPSIAVTAMATLHV